MRGRNGSIHDRDGGHGCRGGHRHVKKLMLVLVMTFLIQDTRLSMLSQEGSDLFANVEDPQVLRLLKSLYGKPGRWNVPPQDGRFLYDLVLAKGYKQGLEIGTSNGYSALWLGLAFRKNGGKLITIEINRDRAKEAQENFRKAGLHKVIDLRVNDAFKEIPLLTGGFDFVFIDASKSDYMAFFDLVYPKVSKDGAITAHNVVSLASSMEEFLKAIQAHPQLETTINKTSSEGISVSLKRE
jgi:caffeoyl-CoA O-methyltransferase